MPSRQHDKNSLTTYRRIIRFDELFSNNTYPSLEELIEDDCSSQTTVFRTLEFMRDQFHAPIVFDRNHGGYCYSENTFRLPALWTTEQEQFALALMKGLSEKLKGTPLYESTEKVLNYLQNNTIKNPNDWEFSINTNAHEETALGWINSHYIFLNGGDFSVDKNTWDVFERCMKTKHQANFEYHFEKKDEWVKVRFNPYQIINSNNRWYVWGRNIDLKENRLYLLDLLRNVTPASHEFKLPKDFDFRNHSSGVFGAFAGKTEHTMKAEFSGWAVPYIKRNIWGKNQNIENLAGGKIRLSFVGSELLPFLSMLLSYGSCAKPIEPPELVTMWKAEIKKMCKL